MPFRYWAIDDSGKSNDQGELRNNSANVQGHRGQYQSLGEVVRTQGQKIIEHCLRIAADIIKELQGTIVKFIGDEGMSRFADEYLAIKATCKFKKHSYKVQPKRSLR